MRRPMNAITFEYWDWAHGYFVMFEVPYSERNLNRIVALRDTRNIRVW